VLQTSGNFHPPGRHHISACDWTGPGGFCSAIGAPLTVTLGASSALGGQLVWGANGFVPFGSFAVFCS